MKHSDADFLFTIVFLILMIVGMIYAIYILRKMSLIKKIESFNVPYDPFHGKEPNSYSINDLKKILLSVSGATYTK